MQITSLHSLNAFLLPIKTVGVQVNGLIPGVFWKPLPPARQLQWSAKRCFVIENKGLDLRTWSSGDWDSYIIVGAKVSRQLNRHWSEWQVWCLRISLALNNPGHIWAVSSWLQNLVGLCCIPPAPFMAEKSWTGLSWSKKPLCYLHWTMLIALSCTFWNGAVSLSSSGKEPEQAGQGTGTLESAPWQSDHQTPSWVLTGLLTWEISLLSSRGCKLRVFVLSVLNYILYYQLCDLVGRFWNSLQSVFLTVFNSGIISRFLQALFRWHHQNTSTQSAPVLRSPYLNLSILKIFLLIHPC